MHTIAMTLEDLLELGVPSRIETPRMILHAARKADAADAFAAASESAQELAPWMPWADPEPTLAKIESYHSDIEEKWHNRTTLDFKLVDKSTQQFIGKAGFHHIDWSIPKLEMGYLVRTWRAGQGYCSEAVTALVEYARTHLGARRLEICSDPENLKSRRVAERAGFVLEGILRQNRIGPGGKLCDSCMYAKIF
ncbi:MAG: GNAT family N-acetyltransferase [Betaproteobacteria bacterium]|nr:GNAT family N-acetyltransferase [Betaproteobacteria bacterium]